jgi:hypothetical protein
VEHSYAVDFVTALAELQRMVEERDALETRIARQKKRVAALAELARPEEDAPGPTGLVEGITDACRTVLRGAERPLLPIEVKERVEALGLPQQKNLLASVHTVLKRLAVSKEAIEVWPQSGSGPAAYTWNPVPRLGFPDPLNRRGRPHP